MAEVSKSGVPSLSTLALDPEHRLTGLIAGEHIFAGDACYIKNDGLVYRATGAAANAAAKVRGFAIIECQSGEAVTLALQGRFRYGASLTPGDSLYLSGTNTGGLANAASTGGTTPLGFVMDPTRIYVQIPVL